MKRLLRKLLTDEEGATMVEYALMVALIATAAVAIVKTLGSSLSSSFTSSNAKFPGAGS